MVPASFLAVSGKISWLWLFGLYFFQTVGELCLSPIGLATVSELAPVRFANFIMGAWFLSLALGNKLAGSLAGFSRVDSPTSFAWLFGGLCVAALLIAGSLWMLTPRVKKLMQAS
jgi:POT family proton-dependent oligopeptide transporter